MAVVVGDLGRVEPHRQCDQRLGAYRLQQCAVQILAVSHPIRRPVPHGDPATERQAGQLLAGAPVAHAQRLGYADVRAQRIGDTELAQDARAIGANLNAGAVLVKPGAPFEHVRADAMTRQRQRGREAADAAAGDEHRSRLALAGTRQGCLGVLVGLRVEL